MAVAAVGVLALALTACGSDGGGGTAKSDDREPLPLDAFWEGTYADWDEAEANAQQMQMEEKVAECMAAEGFDYTPVDYSQGGFGISYSSDDLDVEWGSREFAEKYGYGATTNPWGDIEEPMVEEDPQEWVDPNQDYVMSMSETEQTAYYNALYGDQSRYEDFTEEDWETYEWNWEDGGCQGWAQNEIYGDMMGGSDSEFSALFDDLNAMYEASQTDPRLTAALDKWSACMADKGYPGLAEIWDAQNQFYEKQNAIYDEFYTDDLDWENMTEADWADIERQIQDRLAELTDEEIAMATAEWDCKDESGYADAEYEVMFEYQTEFFNTHKDELEAYAESQK